ncbi:OmpH family outer membrane protein [Parvularcula dongshanensis]|uniref:Outer membrane protein n=1 Tax=Parvularcula dongshanensis TaxID=1173995 RepID=A0A840I315_9PROT|nr:OmpH family outer membrane protein [Parvularcula dongshanensis]MBB4659396.1 outer membrane protein [Parvularcula dongshanensis]
MRISPILGGLVAALGLLVLPTAALAQKMDVLVIDQNRLIADSKAGQSIASQVEALAQSAGGEVQAQAQKVQAEGQALDASKDSMSKEDLNKRMQGLAVASQNVQRFQQLRQAEVAQAEAAALADLSKRIEPLVAEIARKRRAKVVVRRSDVAWLDDDADITAELIQDLDRTVTTITVTKPDLLAQARAAQAQGQAN